ncbi:polyadenylate-binding protein-interacting protein 2-like [Syngnathoides biaculeatus]|uniref:polyadenylate-binding protein-interacting protein 2-like n=1 Tax=Syngnathoides biaculeatus TaxID=300417 RepID=UPI002ADDA7BD|nr:polyadenylate-binding protein-interacting protein 2-like [Syngnathoides biaculeatus]
MKDPRPSHATIGVDAAPSDPRDPDPFAEYVWMEHEEEFDRQVEEELWEEEFMERCFQEMLDEEEESECFIPSRDLPTNTISVLNPNAKEFTPGIQKHVM